MTLLVSVLIFIVILTFLVVIHELGHFLTARLFKVKIDEFGVGFPPKVLTMFRWKGIPFTLNALPIGGFVRMQGEDGPADAQADALESESTADGYPFYTRPAWQRMIIILAGAAVNFVFGIAAFTLIYSVFGIPEKILQAPTLAQISEQTPAAAAGLQAGDVVYSLTSLEDRREYTLGSNDELIAVISQLEGKNVEIKYRRNGQEATAQTRVRTREETPDGQGLLGIRLSQDVVYRKYPWYEMPGRAAVQGVKLSLEFGQTILVALGTMVSDLVRFGRVPTEVAGPVGIVNETVRQEVFTGGFWPSLNFAALFSINLAIMNVLPIPALDGGRAFFILTEKIIGRRRQARIENFAHQLGMVFLLGLIVLITIKDVVVIVRGQ